MKRSALLAPLLLIVAEVVAFSSGIAGPPRLGKNSETKNEEAGEIHWQTSLKAAHKRAVAQNKPILIVFGAEWCTFCKKLEKQTLSSPELAEYINSAFIPVHLDMDKEKKVAEILEIEKLPCCVVITADADLLGRIDGYLTPSPFYEKLVAARERFPVQTASRTSTVPVR